MFKVRIQRSFSHFGYELWISKYDLQNRRSFVAEPINLIFKEVAEGSIWPQPTMQLESNPLGDGEGLMRAMAEGIMEAGIIPSMTSDSAKQIQAMEVNLNDLRKIIDPLIEKVTRK